MRRSKHALGALGFALATLLFAFATNAFAPHARGEARAPAAAARYVAIDGDTFEDRRTGTRYRLVNVDTPETGDRARCRAERLLGQRATQRTRALLAQAQSLIIRPTGRIDAYGRQVVRVLVDGRDLGENLIAEGLARAWRGRREPWCAANGALVR